MKMLSQYVNDPLLKIEKLRISTKAMNLFLQTDK